MRISINKLTIRNFKGIENFTITPGAKNLVISGDNATGKTTIYDSFMWLLTGKDSNSKADFQIKPVDESGNEEHNLETEVEATILIDDISVNLKKRFQEKWTKKRGTAQPEFTGHKTDHFIDDVPVSKKDYEAKLKSIFNPEIFKLVTGPFSFNDDIHWQDRRKTLMEICGGVSDLDVIEANPEYSALKTILAGASFEDHRKKVHAKRKKINAELDQIPVRISELSREVIEIKTIDPDEKAGLKAVLKKKNDELQAIKNNTAISEKQVQVYNIDSDILKVKSSAPDVSELKNKISADIYAQKEEYRGLDRDINIQNEAVVELRRRISLSESAVESIRKQWHAVNDESMVSQEKCPTCGQEIPENQKTESLANFNKSKAERLARITADGKKINASVTQKKADIETANKKIVILKERLKESDILIKKKIDELSMVKSVVDTEAIEKLTAQKQAILNEIEIIKKNNSGAVSSVRTEISGLESELEKILNAEAEIRASEKTVARIKELEASEKDLAAEYERLESELAMLDKFVIDRVSMIEENINGKFTIAGFKMFDVQVNGGISECCETLFEGVPFSRGLNNGARVNVGLDIINTLSKHYGLIAPIFIDNSESVTALLPTEAQMIRLVVDAKCQELEIKTV